MNVSITGMARDAGAFYFPSLFEFIVMFGIVAGVLLVYLFMCENFNILTADEEHE
jgi:Ni/Fe-hydrogenase subunit HybB-like protein